MTVIERCPHCTTTCWSCGGERDIGIATMCSTCLAGGKPLEKAVPCCQRLAGAVKAMREAVELLEPATDRRESDITAARELLARAITTGGR